MMNDNYAKCDAELISALDNLRFDLIYILGLIEVCEEDDESEYSTAWLRKDIKRFINGHL